MKIKFITMFNKNIGSARIRVFNLIPMLKNYFEKVEVISNIDTEINDDTDVVIFQKTVNYELLYDCRKKGIYTCFDIDDLFPQYNKMIKYVDLVIVSTEHLKNVLLKYNKNIIVIPNTLDVEDVNVQLKPKTESHNKNLLFGWYGWARNSRILEKIGIRQYVRVISEFGDITYNSETIDEDLQKFDYIVIPQTKTEHNLCKTHCRFLKAVYLGIPCLVSDMPEYVKLAEEINYPKDYIIKDLNEFRPLLDKIRTREIVLPKIDFDQVRNIIIKNYGPKSIAEIFYQKITENYLSRSVYKEKIKTAKLLLFYKKPLQYLFSVKNKTENSKCRKVITFFGLKLKFRNKKKEQELKLLKLEQKVNSLILTNNTLQNLLVYSINQSRLQYKQLISKEDNNFIAVEEYIEPQISDMEIQGFRFK